MSHLRVDEMHARETRTRSAADLPAVDRSTLRRVVGGRKAGSRPIEYL